GWYGALMAALRPERILGAFLMCPASGLGEQSPERQEQAFMDEVETEEGWRGKFNRHYWLRDFGGFADFFAGKVINDPHSTKQGANPSIRRTSHVRSRTARSRSSTSAAGASCARPFSLAGGGRSR